MSDDRALPGVGRVLVLGAARSGLAAAEALHRLAPGVRVRLSDRRRWEGEPPPGVEEVVGDADEALVAEVDLVVKSPGIPKEAPLVRAAHARGVPVVGEVELAFRLLDGRSPIVGVTGTNGKTTTTELCAAMLEAGGVPAVAAGNIGMPLTSLAGRVPAGTAIAGELSSFQLEDVDRFHARAGVLLNVTPDHLDRHGTLDAYAAAKLRLFARQEPGDVAVLCDDDPWVHALSDDAVPGRGGRRRVRRADSAQDLREAFAASALRGPHNLENALCAAAAAEHLGAARDGVTAALAAFRPGRHRLEDVATVAGVRYVDDSKATNVEAAVRALRSFDAGVHLIAGGSLKGGDFTGLAQAVDARVAGVYLIGEAEGLIADALSASGVPFERCGTLAAAVAAASGRARPGDTVLLSPACASFDQFRDYADRGETFRRLVQELGGVKGRGEGVTLAEQVLLLVTLGLVGFGVVMVYSASSGVALSDYGDSLYFLKREVAYAAIGLAGLAICSRLDVRRLGAISPVLVGASLALLLLVAAIGVSAKGAQRWLALGPFTFQPSELAKLSVCVYAAWMLGGRARPPGEWREVMRPVGTVAGVFAVLLLVERDLGSAIGLSLAAAAVLVVSGTRVSALVRVGGVAFALAGLAIWSESYRRDRLLAFLHPWADPVGNGYQLVQSAIAFGSGGLFGVGLGQGIEKVRYLPEAHTDMIFAIIGEELGLLGVLCVVGAFAALAWAGFSIALRARDPFGKRLAAGITALLVGQAALNFGGVLAITPLTGVPLPLISYGGTSLIVTLAGVGVVLSVAAQDRVREVARPAREPRLRAVERRPQPAALPRAARARRRA